MLVPQKSLLVQDFLKTHSFKELQLQHGVYQSFSKSGHKFSLNYDMIEAKDSDLLAQECRGLILACDNAEPKLVNNKPNYDHVIPGDTRIIAFPLKRFFNHGQGTDNIFWKDPNLSIQEKMDGTLCIVYFDSITLKWCVATRAVPEADLVMDNGIFTFRTLFEQAVKDSLNLSFDQFTAYLNKTFTYCFELTTPYNQIVVKYSNNSVTLLAARDISTLKEIALKDIDLPFPKVETFSFKDVSSLLDWVASRNPIEHEGIVVCDCHFNRLKMKDPSYVAAHKIRDSVASSERSMIEVILHEKDDDVITFLPELIGKNLLKLKDGVGKFLLMQDSKYLELKAEADRILTNDRKTFALLVMKDKDVWSAPMFEMFTGKVNNMKEFVQKNKKEGTWSNSFLESILEKSKCLI